MCAELNTEVINRFSLSEFAAWDENGRDNEVKLNWMLTVDADLWHSDMIRIDAEAANSFDIGILHRDGNVDSDMKDQVYRAWLRLSSSRSEFRVGLQRLNFGSARIIRPLQWFDKLSPMDVLESTRGVNAALAKYYFPNNSTLWTWVILSDGTPKGYEATPTLKNNYDLGGRFQVPFLSGEAALSFDYRPVKNPLTGEISKENRIGFDVRLDSFVGLWAESSMGNMQGVSPDWQLLSAFGVDYTLDIGNGVYLMSETGVNHSANEFTRLSPDVPFSSALISYPLGLLDKVSYFNRIEWNTGPQAHSLVLQRSYDNLVLELSGTWTFVPDMPSQESKYFRLLLSYSI